MHKGSLDFVLHLHRDDYEIAHGELLNSTLCRTLDIAKRRVAILVAEDFRKVWDRAAAVELVGVSVSRCSGQHIIEKRFLLLR